MEESIYDAIGNLWELIARQTEPPNVIVLNRKGFIQWYKYCEENNIDHTHWEGVKIMIDQEQLFTVCVTWRLLDDEK